MDEMPFDSLVRANNEVSIQSFQEELQAEIEDISDFLNNFAQNPFEAARTAIDWKNTLLVRILTKEPMGIQHIVESSAIVSFLATWSNADDEEEKEEAEQKIAAFFPEGITMIFIPALEIGEQLRSNMDKWNRGNPMKS